jgi:hypothetical protein
MQQTGVDYFSSEARVTLTSSSNVNAAALDFEKAQSLERDTIDERRFNVQINVNERTTGVRLVSHRQR